jgi:hypothetical protein
MNINGLFHKRRYRKSQIQNAQQGTRILSRLTLCVSRSLKLAGKAQPGNAALHSASSNTVMVVFRLLLLVAQSHLKLYEILQNKGKLTNNIAKEICQAHIMLILSILALACPGISMPIAILMSSHDFIMQSMNLYQCAFNTQANLSDTAASNTEPSQHLDLSKALAKQLLVMLALTGIIVSMTTGAGIVAGGLLLAGTLGGLTIDLHELMTPAHHSDHDDFSRDNDVSWFAARGRCLVG